MALLRYVSDDFYTINLKILYVHSRRTLVVRVAVYDVEVDGTADAGNLELLAIALPAKTRSIDEMVDTMDIKINLHFLNQ